VILQARRPAWADHESLDFLKYLTAVTATFRC